MKSHAVIYCRVSTDDQVDNNSLPMQKRDCATQAERLGCDVLETFADEGVSGTREDRPAMAKMLAFCTAQREFVRYVIVKDIDRFSRDVLVYHALRSRFAALDIRLYSVNQPNIAEGTAEARLLEAMFSGISQYERDKILRRTRDGTREAIANGGWTCFAPYGYRTHRTEDNVPTLQIDPREATMVKSAYELFSSGKSLIEVTSRLNALGYRSKRGRPLSFQSIHCLLRNPVYIGKIQSRHFPERLIDGRHPPIISTRLWEKAQRRWLAKLPSPARDSLSSAFPLTGTLRCCECDAALTGSYSRSGTGRRYGYYHCRKTGCQSPNLGKEKIECNFGILLQRLRPTPDWWDRFERAVIGEWRCRQKSQSVDGRKFKRNHRSLEAKRDRIEDSFFSGRIDEATYLRNLKRVENELAGVDATQEDGAPTEDKVRAMLAASRQFFFELSNSWEYGLPENKRRIQGLLFPAGLRCGQDGVYRTLDLPPTLAVFRVSQHDRSKLVAHVGKSWNSLMTFLQSIEQFMKTTPASAGETT